MQGVFETGAKFFGSKDNKKQLRELDLMQATKEMGELNGRSDQVIADGGIVAFHRQRDDILRKFDHLTAADITKFYKESDAPANTARRNLYKGQEDFKQKLKDEQRKANLAQLSLTTNIVSEQVAGSRSNDELDSNINNAVEQFNKTIQSGQYQGRDELFLLQAQQAFYSQLATAAGESTEKGIELAQQAQAYNELISSAYDIYEKHGDNFQAAKQELNSLRIKLGLPLDYAASDTDPLYNVEQKNRQFKAQRERSSAAVKNNPELQKLQGELTGQTILTGVLFKLFNAKEWGKLQGSAILTPEIKSEIEEYAKEYTNYRDNISKRKSKIVSLQAEAVQLKERLASKVLSFEQKDVNSAYQDLNSLLKTLVTQGAFGENAEGLVGQLGQELQPPEVGINLSDEDKRAQMETILNSFQERIELIGQAVEIVNEEDAVARERLAAVGLHHDPATLREKANNGQVLQEYTDLLQQVQDFQRGLEEAEESRYGNTQYRNNANFRNPNSADLLATAYIDKDFYGNNIILPFKKPGHYAVTSGLSGSESAKGRVGHNGTDFGIPAGTELIALVDGEIIEGNPDPNGYGWYLTVKGDDGLFYRYAHLSKKIAKNGQRVTAGEIIALSGGTPGTQGAGRTTGDHLHFEIRNSYSYGGKDILNPETVLRERYQKLKTNKPQQQPRRNNIPDYDDVYSNLTPEEQYLLDNGGRVYKNNLELRDGKVIPLKQAFNEAKPIEQSMASISKKDYKPKKDSNYGYKVLAQDDSFRRELHNVANRLDIPAVWLADLMQFESGMNPAIQNSIGATGLIQFIPATARGLGTTTAALKRMTRTQQLKYVEKFLKEYGQINTLPELVAAVFGGPALLNKLRKNPQAAYNTPDMNVKMSTYLKRLGSAVGRQYEIPGVTDLQSQAGHYHTSYEPGCSICAKLQDTGSTIVPHKAPVA